MRSTQILPILGCQEKATTRASEGELPRMAVDHVVVYQVAQRKHGHDLIYEEGHSNFQFQHSKGLHQTIGRQTCYSARSLQSGHVFERRCYA